MKLPLWLLRKPATADADSRARLRAGQEPVVAQGSVRWWRGL